MILGPLALTYLLHGVLWAGAVALLARSRAFSPSTQSYLWLAALIGPLATSAWALSGTVHRPYARDFELIPAVDATPLTAATLALVAALALGGARFGLMLLALRRRLRDRTPVHDARLLQRLERLRGRTRLRRVTLTQSAAIQVPLVLGRAEICLPAARLHVASLSELDAVLAHELAHLVRRDGVVFPLVGLVQSLCWLQPLNHWIAARFKQSAELACDDCAVELTGDRLALAQALARAATEAVGTMLPAMARPRPRSALVERVRRLLAVQGVASGRAGWAAVCCCVLALGTVGMSVRAARPPSPPDPTERISALLLGMERTEREIAGLDDSDSGAARRIELQQELRHARETADWIERESAGQARP
ncbi:MAG TPA: M56 family metallopeptidase [Polyangiales bacterium]|nr:M56 family metallopeptidase [Polyangiales bacterium]